MSDVSIQGQEDDDFAYEDEHIELESENQEYDDLAESEFDKHPSAIRAEVKSPIAPGPTAPPASGLKPAVAEVASTQKSKSPPQAVGPSAQRSAATGGAVPRPRPSAKRSETSETKRRSKTVAKPQKRGTKPKNKAKSLPKAVASPVTKKKKPTPTKSVAKKAKALPSKKAGARGTGPSARKKTAERGSRKVKRSGAARTKRRKA